MTTGKPYILTSDISGTLSEWINRLSPSSISLIDDVHTHTHCLPLLQEAIPSFKEITLKPGEQQKNLTGASFIWEKLTENKTDRKGLVIVLGGGVLGDMGGFCAATFKRGISFILIPTTLLAQVDASVGGKLAIDFQHYKNHIGVFQEPVCTLIDTAFLKTLPESELRSGFAEIIKHCLIADQRMWLDISKKNLKEQDWNKLVAHSVEIKNRITTEDPKESGLRKILNFGHTVGHAIESAALIKDQPLLHGEAIAAGMICESFIACRKGLISEIELKSVSTYIRSIYTSIPISSSSEELLTLMAQDKKNNANKILMSLPSGLGSCRWDIETSPEEIISSLEFYSQVHP